MINSIIIDDEQHCVDTLAAMLAAKFSTEVSVVATTTDSRQAVTLIDKYRPQLVFMDVEMPHISGIQLMYAMPGREFAVVFTTAHDRYALPALKTEAVDYLLKPISLDELAAAIRKVAKRTMEQVVVPERTLLPQNKILLPTRHGVYAANVCEIVRIAADGNYSVFHFDGKASIVVAKTLKEYEEQLATADFFRIHQSHLINLHYVAYFHPGLEEYVILTNGDQVEVSRRRKPDFLRRLSRL